MFARFYNFNEKVTEIKKVSVSNLISKRSERSVANQYCINTIYSNDENAYSCLSTFQSYSTICLKYYHSARALVIYPAAFSYSKTTTKYAKQFLSDYCYFSDEEIKEIVATAKIESYGDDCPLVLAF